MVACAPIGYNVLMFQHEALKMPTRVSRLYPLFALAFLFTSAALFYNWQYQTINSDATYFAQNRKIEILTSEVESLKFQQENDQNKLASQELRINAAAIQLKELEGQLTTKNSELSTKAAALKKAEEQLKNQEGQLATNSAEIERLRTRPPLFSFQNESSLPDYETKKEAVKKVVSNAYDTIQEVYGAPYLLSSIVITFVNNFTIPGSSGEIIIENGPNGININIHLKDFDENSFEDTNTIIHEIIHGFHGVAVLDSSAYEEGMTVAAADVVMEKMVAAGTLPAFTELYLTASESQYTNWNNSLKIYADSEKFYSDPNVSRVYQLIGKAWMRFYREDPLFFKKLNDAYYPKAQRGIIPDNVVIRDAIKSVISTVGGTPIETYLSENRAFNPN